MPAAILAAVLHVQLLQNPQMVLGMLLKQLMATLQAQTAFGMSLLKRQILGGKLIWEQSDLWAL
jgi:hypothetical protein